MTIVGRSKIDHPSLGTAGGSALHASIETIYTNIGDDLAGRFDTFASVANSTVSTIDHNFGVTFNDLRVLIYTGTHPNLTRVTDPVASGWTIAATVGFTQTKIDVTTPSSGGPHTFAVFITQGKEVDASTTAGGIVSTGTQTFAGAKTWNDVQTFKANSGADSAGSYDTSYQWTIGRSTANDAIVHTVYGSASFGTAIPSYSSSTTRYIGNKFASLLFRLNSTATTGFRAQAGAYFNGTTNLLTTLNQTASRIVLNTDTTASGIAYELDVDANISHAADAAASFVTAHQITFQGIHAIGPSSGLGTGSAAYHLAYGTTVSRMTSSAGSGAFSGRTALFVGANEYLDASGTQKAITTGGATWAEFTTSTAADSTVVYALKTNTTSQTADIALSGTNVTLFQVTASSIITLGASSAINITSPSHITMAPISVGNTGTADTQKRLVLNNNAYNASWTGLPARDSAANTLGGGCYQIIARTSDSASSHIWYSQLSTDGNTTAATQIAFATQSGAFTWGPSGGSLTTGHTVQAGTSTNTATFTITSNKATAARVMLVLSPATGTDGSDIKWAGTGGLYFKKTDNTEVYQITNSGQHIWGAQQSLNYNGQIMLVNGSGIAAGTPSSPTTDQSGALEINSNLYRGAAGNRYETTLTGAGIAFNPRTTDALDCISFYTNIDNASLTASVGIIGGANALGQWNFVPNSTTSATIKLAAGTQNNRVAMIGRDSSATTIAIGNSATATFRIADSSNSAGWFFVYDSTSSASAVVHVGFGNSCTIMSQFGSKFVSGSPGASQCGITFANTNSEITFTTGSSGSSSLRVFAISPQC